MLTGIRDFLKSFFSKDGHYIFVSTIFQRVVYFATSVFVVRLLSKEEYGNFVYANSIIAFLIPFAGFGVIHSLLRFGALKELHEEKKAMFENSLREGLFISIPLFFLIILTSSLFTLKLPGAQLYLNILSFGLFSQFLFRHYMSYLRIKNDNRKYAFDTILSVVVTAISIIFSLYFFGAFGYVIAISLSPLLCFFLFFRKNLLQLVIQSFQQIKWKANFEKEFYTYGIQVSIGSIASQLVLVMDNLMIGNILSDPEEISLYRIGAIIPLNLMFIPSTFLFADFVTIAKEYRNRSFLIQYVSKYLKLFSLVVLILIVPLYYLGDFLILFFYGNSYEASIEIFQILMLGIVGAFLLRILFGNLLQAVGKSSWSSGVAFCMLCINFVLTFLLTNSMGIRGAAIASSCSFWLTGIIAGILFWVYLHQLDDGNKSLTA